MPIFSSIYWFMARGQGEQLAQEICAMAFRNRDFCMELEHAANDMLETYFEMKRNMRSLWDCFEDFSDNLQHLEVYLNEEYEEFQVMAEEFRNNVQMKTPDFTQMWERIVDQHRRLDEVHEDLFDEVGPYSRIYQALNVYLAQIHYDLTT